MPSNAILEQKKQFVSDLVAKINESAAGVLVDYKGITVENDTKLRTELREAGVEYVVIKNTLLERAFNEVGFSDLNKVLEGMTSIAISKDPVSAAKIISKYAEKLPTFNIKAGYVDGTVIDEAGVKALAELPSREVLIAQVLGGLNAPISGLVNVLQGNIRGLVVALNAISEKKAAE